ncbi:hypothetical protein RBU61_07635 [Tissierella sp. MB52-C2]|uniref:hypothetical protein n=1 Tax=Tissierella sp. MB52-C2 TaxID=3070999 RepID=UPI00280A96C2|nr:hypothetical protein [Tissierella sp. MB52-C2]WMM26535.1 hypothetical protein RBU61_07635 [Tissierella sp. MB52-C2]
MKVQKKKQVTFNTIDYGVILNGIADDVDEYWDDNGSEIEIGGRDKSMIFLENDAEPISLNKVIL